MCRLEHTYIYTGKHPCTKTKVPKEATGTTVLRIRVLVRVVASLSHVSVDARGDAHGHHFLEKQFTSIWNLNLADLRWAANAHWRATFVSHLLQVRLGSQPATFTNMNAVLIRVAEEPVTDKVGTAVCDQTITFHLSHA